MVNIAPERIILKTVDLLLLGRRLRQEKGITLSHNF
jgi:hypothetical protein